MTLPIAVYGQDILRRPSEKVTAMSDEIRSLVNAMLATMQAEAGVGLAAQQVGHVEAVCVVDVTGVSKVDGQTLPPMPLVLVNPVLTMVSDDQEWEQEGCLSFPDVFVRIKRAADIDVSYKDMDWQDQTLHAHGFLARAIQHEVDHLNGVLLVDRMSQVQKISIAGKLRRLKKTGAS